MKDFTPPIQDALHELTVPPIGSLENNPQDIVKLTCHTSGCPRFLLRFILDFGCVYLYAIGEVIKYHND